MMEESANGAPENLSFLVKVADNIWTRGLGLLGRKELKQDEGLWIKPCVSVHTLLMRFPVDLIYLDAENKVVKARPRLEPFSFSAGNQQTHSVLQLPEGFLSRNHVAVGKRLVIVPVGKNKANISLETGAPRESLGSQDSEVPQNSAGRSSRHTGRGLRILFPSPLFVAPIALPIIMFGIGLGLGLRGALQLVDFTVGKGFRATARVLGLRKPNSDSPSPLDEPSTSPNGSRELLRLANADPTAPEEEAAVLVTSGQDEGRLFRVSEEPITIGTGETCGIRLPAAPGIAEEHARLWWRDGRLMLHHIAPNLITAVVGKQIIWTAMEDGDEVSIGPYMLRIRVGRRETQDWEEDTTAEYPLSPPLEERQLVQVG